MNVETVIKKNRCFSCGMCSSVCPVDVVGMQYEENTGFYRPYIDSGKCVNCGKCIKYCPACHSEDSGSLIGEYISLVLAHSSDKDVRQNSTSGGVVNALVRYMLKKGIVEAVLMVGYSPDSVTQTAAYIITAQNMESLKNNPRDFASRYVLVPVLEKYRELTEKYSSVAVVGTPCQINAVSSMSSGKCKIYKIGIACSSGTSYLATQQYKKLNNMPESKMYYRGDGGPGKNKLTQDDHFVEYNHNGSLFERMFSSQIFKNPGCRYCRDQFAEMADISFCDFWNLEEVKSEHIGNSCIIIRNSNMAEIYQDMLEEGDLEKIADLTEEDIISGQMQVLKAKKGNIHKNPLYKAFVLRIQFVFRHQLYKKYSYKHYERYCKYYRKIIGRSKDIYKK